MGVNVLRSTRKRIHKLNFGVDFPRVFKCSTFLSTGRHAQARYAGQACSSLSVKNMIMVLALNEYSECFGVVDVLYCMQPHRCNQMTEMLCNSMRMDQEARSVQEQISTYQTDSDLRSNN